MKYFLIVFFIGVLAFSDADLSIREMLALRGITEKREITDDMSTYEKYFYDYVTELKLSFLVPFGGFDE